jgi:hypothetical protein
VIGPVASPSGPPDFAVCLPGPDDALTEGRFYLDGREAVPLQAGAASVVIYADGHIDVGTWGREVTKTPNVTAVLSPPTEPMQRPATRYLGPTTESRDFFTVSLPSAS